jgi:hypothetical protein
MYNRRLRSLRTDHRHVQVIVKVLMASQAHHSELLGFHLHRQISLKGEKYILPIKVILCGKSKFSHYLMCLKNLSEKT